MKTPEKYDIIIVGGSYAGLSAAMSLGRSMRQVLVIDGGKPCNAQTPHSHNFLTHDGHSPAEISGVARQQVEQYDTIKFYQGFATRGSREGDEFQITTHASDVFSAKKLIFATGLKDIMPDIPGFSECWGISVLHCPYCHGYEVRRKKTGIIANGEVADHYASLIAHWTEDLVLFTNGPASLSANQKTILEKDDIQIIETEIESLDHSQGQIQQVVLKDQTKVALDAIYSSPDFNQHCDIPEQLGVEFTEEGLIVVDAFQKTSVPDVYACGDNSNFRAVSLAVSSGSVAGIVANKDLIETERAARMAG